MSLFVSKDDAAHPSDLGRVWIFFSGQSLDGPAFGPFRLVSTGPNTIMVTYMTSEPSKGKTLATRTDQGWVLTPEFLSQFTGHELVKIVGTCTPGTDLTTPWPTGTVYGIDEI